MNNMHFYVVYILIVHHVSSSPTKKVCPNMEEHEVFVPQDAELLAALGGGEDEFHVSRHIGFFKITTKKESEVLCQCSRYIKLYFT